MRQQAQENKPFLITERNPKSPVSEAYRSLRTNIQFSSVDEQMKVLMVASAQAGEGKTTTVSNLAVAYAQEGKKVLLIDADLRKPTIHEAFAVSNRTGLTHLLINQYSIAEVVKESSIPNLSVIPSGPIPPNPSEILASKRMLSLLVELKELYDVILFDTPPVLAVTDGLIIGSMVDGVILIVNSGRVKRELVRKAKANLEHVKARVLGVLLNNKTRSEAEEYYN